MKINIEHLEENNEIIDISSRISSLLKSGHAVQTVTEKSIASLPEDAFCIASFETFSATKEARESVKSLKAKPCSYNALSEVWNCPFSTSSIRGDLERYATKLTGTKLKIRNEDAGAFSSESQQIAAYYPSPKVVEALLPQFADLLNEPISQNTILSSTIASVYFYRLHPMPDGNGRVSRGLLNISLRNYGVIETPRIFMSCQFLYHLDVCQKYLRSNEFDIEKYVIYWMKSIESYLQYLRFKTTLNN